MHSNNQMALIYFRVYRRRFLDIADTRPVFIQSAAVLICAMIAQGDICRFKNPPGSGVLKCEEKMYRADEKTRDAVNHCGIGRNGVAMFSTDYTCIFEKLGYSDKGLINMENLSAGYRKIYTHHSEQMIYAVQMCSRGTNRTDISDIFFPCLLRAFTRECGHKTCDWITTFD
ncbi:unnamed protein product [Allacma fusca]|uniref:Uncharacterized protein n=1 Tax=Allacma fusca TaxID=39272 RepID=A0A8J2PH17_9HEXA|nr:unnamed protein product [Allacma fusca]